MGLHQRELGSERCATVPIGKETAEILAATRPAAVHARALVFATRKGLPLDRWNLLRKHLKPAAKQLGLPGVKWHLLRHSHAMMLDSVGKPIGTMQSLLGHSTPDITREIYLHAIPEEQRRAVKSVERLVFGSKFVPKFAFQRQQLANCLLKTQELVVGAPRFVLGTSCAQVLEYSRVFLDDL